jgi:hypothetical protein
MQIFGLAISTYGSPDPRCLRGPSEAGGWVIIISVITNS